MGFAFGDGAYLKDRWNWLDFVVTITSALFVIPGVPRVSVIRAFRVIRPMRTLRRLPGMRALVRSLLNAIPGLLNVAAMILLVCFIWGAVRASAARAPYHVPPPCFFGFVLPTSRRLQVGVQLWMGDFHQRCRLTPLPIVVGASELLAPPGVAASGLDAVYWTHLAGFAAGGDGRRAAAAVAYVSQIATNRSAYPYCGGGAGDAGAPVDVGAGALWRTPVACVWPIDTSDTATCGGLNDCGPLTLPGGGVVNRVCGSNYDGAGNPRFVDERFMSSDTFVPELAYGVPTFDDLGSAFFAMTEAVTQSGWSDVLHFVSTARAGGGGGLDLCDVHADCCPRRAKSRLVR